MPKNTKDSNKKKIEKEVNKKSTTASSKRVTKKVTTTKKATKSSTTKATKKATSKTPKKAVTSRKKTENSIKTNEFLANLEYYDLPYRYNQTVVKMLAQTPHTLFVYWDISDDDRQKFISQYGDNFFNNTKPVLIITNKTKNYTFEITINDFANCWYFNINDEKCEYSVELGRRPINQEISIPNNYVFVSTSNKIESPNGHILFEKEQNTVYFSNVKTKENYSKDVVNLHFMNRLQKIYKIYDLYKTIYKNEEYFDVDNPTSTFK